jgi:curli biogenesis system outer membrane secretion channel CsgG
MKKLLILVGILAGWLVAPAQDSALPTLFVKPLDGDLSQIQGWQPALGEGLAEMLITELAKTGKFELLESTAIKDLVGEINLGEAGYVGEKEKVDKGGFKGADFMFVGKVTRFGANRRGINLGGFVPGSGGRLGLSQSRNDVRIDWRIVDASTRSVLKTGSSVGEHNGIGFDIGVGVNGHGGGIGFQNQDFMNSALGKATVKALSNIVNEVRGVTVPVSGRRQMKAQAAEKEKTAQQRQLEQANAQQQAIQKTPGKVLAVPSAGVVIVSLGSNQGFKAGDKLQLFETIDTKDDKGVVVFTDEKLVGEVILESVQADRSKANYRGDAPVKAGWIVKKN